MLATLTGVVRFVQEQAVVLEVHGVGFTLTMSPGGLVVGDTAQLHTYLHWSADHGPSLFGFVSAHEKAVFVSLISCSGIGPKVALALLGKLGAHAVITALVSGDQAALSSVSGVGPKKAEQIVVQLRSKVDHLIESPAMSGSTNALAWKEVSDALVALNYSRPEISRALQQVAEQQAGKSVLFPELLRNALAHLAKPLR
jgi:holliday junction DNA helicase RuvA